MPQRNLVLFDLEWNIGYQPYTFNYQGVQQTFRGEIIEIGAVKIDEDGCEAAAYTVLGVEATAMLGPEEEIDFTLDKPFVFAITGIDGLPLFVGGCIIGAVSTVLLIFEKGATHRIFEKLIIGLLLVITFGFIAGLFIAPPNPKEVVAGLIPRFKGTDTVLMATSMLGATVMPHAIYLHSTLVNDHYAPGEAKPSIKKLLHGSKIDVAWALILAGSVNLALLILAANSLYGMTGTDTIEGAQRAIQHVLGPVIGTIFSIGLLASSLSSTSVGTYAGSEIMHGLLRIKAPMWACRVVTLVPALVVLWFANNPTEALIVGQVVLSVGIPFAIIPLMRYTHDRTLMGEYVDGPVKHVVNIAVAALIVALNVVLIVLTMLGKA